MAMALTLFTVGTPAFAVAATSVALTDVSGPTEDDVARSIELALRGLDGIRFLTRQDWLNASDEAGLDPIRDQRALADRVGVDRLVKAKISRGGDRWVLVVEVFDARGQRVKRWRARSKKVARLTGIVRKLLVSRIGPSLTGGAAPRKARRRTTSTASRKPIKVGMLRVRGGKRTAQRLTRLLKKYPQMNRVADRRIQQKADELGAGLDNAGGRVKVARALGIQAWVAVRSKGRKKRYAAQGRLYSGHNGQLVETVQGRGRSEREALAVMLKRLQQPLASTKAASVDAIAESDFPPPPAPRRRRSTVVSPDSTATAEVETTARPRTGGRSTDPVFVAVGFSLQNRDFSYNDDAFDSLRPYELSAGPAIAGEVRWYPAGHFTDGFLTHIGIESRLRYLVGVTSEDSGGEQFNTSSVDVYGGVRGRLPLGAHEVGLGLGVGSHSFDVDVPEEGPALPGVSYTYLRAGADGRVALPADLQLYLGAAWRQVFSSGDIGGDEWFPNASQGGIDATLAVGWNFLWNLEARLGAEYTRYFFSLNPELGDVNVAGGAVDQYISGTFELVLSL